MAIKNTDIVDKSVKAAIDDLNKAFGLSVQSLKEMVDQGSKLTATLGGAKTIKDVTSAQEKYNVVLKDTKNEQIQAIKLKQQEEVLKQQVIKTQRSETTEKTRAEKEQKKLNDASAKASSLYAKESAALTTLRNKARDAGLQFGINSKQYKDLAVQVQKADTKLKNLDANLGVHNRSVGNYSKALGGVKNAITGMVGAYIGFQAAIRVIGDVIKTNRDFEKSLSSLRAITGVSKDELKFFAEQAKRTSSRTLQSANEIAKAYELVGSKAPELLKNKEALTAVTEQAIILSEATGGQLGLEESVNAVTAGMNVFGISASNAAQIANVFAAGSLEGSANVQSLTESLKNVGPVAKDSNLSLEQTTALLEVLGEKQIYGAEAGTKLRGSLLKLKDAGLGYASGQFVLRDALLEANGQLAKMGTQLEKDAAKAKIFGAENITVGTILLANVDKYDKLTAAVTGTNTALDQQAIQNDNFAASTQKLGIAWDNLMLSFGNSSTAASGIKILTEAFQALRYSIEGWDTFFIEKSDEFFSKIKGEVDQLATTDEKLRKLNSSFEVISEILSENDKKVESNMSAWNSLKSGIVSLNPFLDTFIKTNVEEGQAIAEKRIYYENLLKSITKYTDELKKQTTTTESSTVALDAENKVLSDKLALEEKLAKELADRLALEAKLQKLRDDFADAEGAAEGDKGILDDYLANLKTKTDASLESDAKIKASGDALMQDINDNFDEKLRKQREVLDAEIKKEQERAAFKEEVEANFKESAINLVNTLFEYSQDKREQEKEAIDAQLQQQLTNETLTQDQRAALTAKAEVEKEKIRKKQNNIAIKQAIFERSLSVVSIIQSTAEAIAKSVALFPLTSGQPWATVAKLNGAVQIASVLTAPIPRYAVGTENSKEGVARVGEQGAELIVDKKYGAWIANKEQHAYLSGGSKVYTAGETAGIMDLVTRNEMINGNNGNTSVQMPFINKLIQANKLQSNEIVSAIKAQKFHIHNQSGINTTVIRKQNNMISQLKG